MKILKGIGTGILAILILLVMSIYPQLLGLLWTVVITKYWYIVIILIAAAMLINKLRLSRK